MFSTINTYRNETVQQDLALYLAERQLSRSADPYRPDDPQARAARLARSIAITRQIGLAAFALLALVVALAVPVVAAPLV